MQQETPMYSSYYYELDDTAKQRYREKMEKLGALEDPYLMYDHGQEIYVDWYDWPQVEYPNIYNFLIGTPSVYTGESLKSNKSLDTYNFYVNSWVENINVFPIPASPGTYFGIGCVKHSPFRKVD